MVASPELYACAACFYSSIFVLSAQSEDCVLQSEGVLKFVALPGQAQVCQCVSDPTIFSAIAQKKIASKSTDGKETAGAADNNGVEKKDSQAQEVEVSPCGVLLDVSA